MNILITGSAGFIGYNFSKYLLENTDHNIIGVDNLNNYYSPLIKKKRIEILQERKKFIFFKIDITNKKNINKLFKKYNFNLVINFAAQAGVRYSIINPRSYIENNILGFFNILDMCIKYKIKNFFYASSSSVYGDSRKFPLNEHDRIAPKNLYGLSKKINEEISDLISKNRKMSIIGLRFFTVFGEWGRPDMLIYKYLKSCFNKKLNFYLYNYGNHYRDFTYINDVCVILNKLVHKKLKPSHQVLNICSSKPYKITKILDYISKQLGSYPKVKKIDFQETDVIKTYGNNNKLKKFLKFDNFTDINKSLYNTIEWYKNNFKLFS